MRRVLPLVLLALALPTAASATGSAPFAFLEGIQGPISRPIAGTVDFTPVNFTTGSLSIVWDSANGTRITFSTHDLTCPSSGNPCFYRNAPVTVSEGGEIVFSSTLPGVGTAAGEESRIFRGISGGEPTIRILGAFRPAPLPPPPGIARAQGSTGKAIPVLIDSLSSFSAIVQFRGSPLGGGTGQGLRVTMGFAQVQGRATPFPKPVPPPVVHNPSFEDLGGPLDQSCGHGCSFRFGSIPHWALSDFSNSGQFHPSTGPHGIFATFAPNDGHISAFSNGGTISQKVGTVQAGLIYTLSLEIGHRRDEGFAGSADLLVGNTTFMAMGTVPRPGHWSTFTARFTGTAANAGDPITIQLKAPGAVPGHSQGNFDSVKLTTTVIPEPGTLGLLGTGLIGLAGLARRKLRR